MEPRKALEATSGLAREHMGAMGAMGETHMEWWETRRNRGAHRGWLSPWQLPHSPPGYSANKVWAFLEFLKLTLHGYWPLLMFQASKPQWLGGGQAVKTCASPQGRGSWKQRWSSEPPVANLLYHKASSYPPYSQIATQRDWQSIPQSWGTQKAYLKIEAYKNYTSNPQKRKGGHRGLLISILNTPIRNWLIDCQSQWINSQS